MRGSKHMRLLLGVVVAFAGTVLVGISAPAGASSCIDGDTNRDFSGTRNGTVDTLTIWTKDNRKLCNDVSVNFTTFKVDNPNYNGGSFKGNPTAYPQSFFANQTVVLKKGTNGKTTIKMEVPDACTPYQIDAYVGPMQTAVVDSGGLVGPPAIVGKLFDKTKTDCSVPKVEVCNTNTGLHEMVDKDKANTAPYTTDFSKCKVDVCNTNTGLYEKVDKSKANTSPYTTDLSKCKTEVCNTDTGVIQSVDKKDANTAPYTTNLDKCEQVKVCIKDTGKTGLVTKDEAKDTSKYGDEDDKACNPETPETPETPKTPETPQELPKTGPIGALSGIIGVGSIAGATTAYIRSRQK